MGGMTKCVRYASGVESLQATRFQNIPGDVNSLSYNHVTCIFDDPTDPEKFLWICTKGGGINRMDKETAEFIRLTKDDGLPDKVVYGMLPDDAGNLWGSTNKGIFCMSRVDDPATDDGPTYRFRSFFKSDGLQDNEFNTGAYAKMPDGRLMFAGVNGLNIFDPEMVLTEHYEPDVYITSLAVNNRSISPGDATEILGGSVEMTRRITLSHQQNMVTLTFAALDFRSPERIRYRYQLEGADDTWVDAGNQHSATFAQLQPGNYTFRVQGTNSHGVWSKQIAELNIKVLPPWWFTWWAYAGYGIVLLLAITWYLRFSINRARLHQQLSYEKLEAERVKELDELKTRMFMNLTHEFRTPLTIILGMAQQVLDDPQEYFRDGMHMIKRNGENLLGMVNKMLNLSRLESGKMTLDNVQSDIVHILRNIVDSFDSYAASKRIQLHFLPEVDSVVMDFDPDKLQQVIGNLLSNALKFTPIHGNIYCSIRSANETLSIRVKDTGRGIPEKDLPRIFDRFFRADNSLTGEEGTGIGLALVSELVKLMDGTITVGSPPRGNKVGTEFIISLPIRQEAERQVDAAELLPSQEEPERISTSGNELPLLQDRFTAETGEGKDLILLVEDNADLVAYVASCLSDYQLAVADNGKEGLEMAIELIPDIIISDVMMPVMDGFELCRNLKSDERTRHIPVIMLTARVDVESKLEGLELGANAYLTKPYEKQELLLTIKNLYDLRSNLQSHYRAVAGLAADSDIPETQGQGEAVEDAFVIKVREVIHKHIGEFDFTVERLANELYLSYSQLSRKLNALTGYSSNQFIQSVRLGKAKQLLLDSDLSITSIAYDCGFGDPSYFSRVFKKTFGQTPVDWRSSAAPSTSR